MNVYIINLTDTLVEGRFDSLAEAESMAGPYDYTIVTDAGDIESQLKRDEMLEIYNGITGAKLKKFANKVEGARRTFTAMEEATFIRKTTEAPITSHPRRSGAVAKVWELADQLRSRGEASRSNLLKAATEAGLNPNTAKTQWQAWRKATLV